MRGADDGLGSGRGRWWSSIAVCVVIDLAYELASGPDEGNRLELAGNLLLGGVVDPGGGLDASHDECGRDILLHERTHAGIANNFVTKLR